jgi:hypothetical protein
VTIALICPYSFANYEIIEQELLKNNKITKLMCATPNACKFAKIFSEKHQIEYYKEERGGKVFNLRKIVQMADKVVLFEYLQRDETKYSLTQKALAEAIRLKRDMQYIEYKR